MGGCGLAVVGGITSIGSFVVIIIGNVMDFSMLAKICCCCCYLATVPCLWGVQGWDGTFGISGVGF